MNDTSFLLMLLNAPIIARGRPNSSLYPLDEYLFFIIHFEQQLLAEWR